VFIANNKNVKGLEELKNKSFETYLNIFPQTLESYKRVGEHFKVKSGFVMKVKIENKPGIFIAKGETMDKGEYPILEENVYLSPF
jgi:hypothetical protein